MSDIKWSDDYSVNIEEIDNQHKKLVSIISSLYDSVRNNISEDILENIIKELISYTIVHFNTEERYFVKYNYNDAKNHQKEHSRFIETIKNFKEKYDKEQSALDLEILNFLGDWLINHIQNTDKKYSSFFNNKGLE